MSRHCIVITGMHRAGTSLHAGIVSLLGADMGKTLGPKAGVNDKGYFEHKKIMRNNQHLLEALGFSWDYTGHMPNNWLDRSGKFIKRAEELVEESFSASSVFAIKDPRICRLMPMWKQIFEKLEISTSFILCTRHPNDVYASLNRREPIDKNKAFKLWQIHYEEFQQYVDAPYLVCDYNTTMDRPTDSVNRLRSFVNKPLSCGADDLRQFMAPELRRNNIAGDIENNAILSLYQDMMTRSKQY